MGSIYKITNKRNDKAYIGQTRHDAVKTRIRDHLRGKGSQLVKQAIEKYGQDAFTYEILHDGILPEFLDDLEIEAIEKYNTIAPHGYNLRSGGGGGSHCEETRRKISKAQKGKSISAETRRKLSEANKGRKLSEKTRRKISEGHKGKPLSEEHCRNIAKARKGKKRAPFSKEHCHKLSEALKGEKNHQYGKSHSLKTRQKISKANKGRKHSEDSRRKMSETHKGKKLSEEHRRKISERQKGRPGKPHSKETKRKMSETRKGRPAYNKGKKHSEETRRKMSEARETPERTAARNFFFSLPTDIDLKEKQNCLRQRFPDRPDSTIRKWIKKFNSEAPP